MSVRVDKEVVVHIQNGILLSYKQEHIWVCPNEVDELGAYYTGWSQKEKDKYCILTHRYGTWTDGTNDPTCRAAKETQTKRTDF